MHIIEGGTFKGIANLSFEGLTHSGCQVREGFEDVFSIGNDGKDHWRLRYERPPPLRCNVRCWGWLPGMCLRYSLLRASKQIYCETIPVLYRSNLFSFRAPHRWNKFIGATKLNRHLIKRIHLDIHLFGRGDDSLWSARRQFPIGLFRNCF